MFDPEFGFRRERHQPHLQPYFQAVVDKVNPRVPLQIETLAHPNSHAYVGGENMDFYTSNNDPVFYLLHAQVDRPWTVWQGQDYASRRRALDGTVTVANLPPSENATLSTVMHMGVAGGGDVPISQAMSPIENQYCYMYL